MNETDLARLLATDRIRRLLSLYCAAGSALTVNLVPVLSSTGLTRGVAMSLAGLATISAILGRVIGGVLLDRFNARLVGGVAVLLPIATSAILLGAPGNVPLAIVGFV